MPPRESPFPSAPLVLVRVRDSDGHRGVAERLRPGGAALITGWYGQPSESDSFRRRQDVYAVSELGIGFGRDRRRSDAQTRGQGDARRDRPLGTVGVSVMVIGAAGIRRRKSSKRRTGGRVGGYRHPRAPYVSKG
jgi:hypothetical protein